MARGEVRYRLSLDSNFKEKAEESANAMGKVDTAFAKSTEKAAAVANATDLVAKKMAGLGEAAGLPAGPLRTLSDVSDLASVGLENLTKGAAGFNAASIGVVGAGLAIGAGLGTLLRQLGETEFGMNKLGLSTKKLDEDMRRLYDSMFGAPSNGPAGFDPVKIATEHQEALKKQIDGQLKLGATLEQIQKQYHGHNSEVKTATSLIDAMVVAQNKANEAAKKAAEQADKAGMVLWESAVKSQKAWDDFGDDVKKKGTEAFDKWRWEAADAAKATFKSINEAWAMAQIMPTGKNFGALLGAQMGTGNTIVKYTKDWKDALMGVADVFQQIGGKAGGLLGNMFAGVVGITESIKGWKDSGAGFAGMLGKIGAIGGIAGTVFGVGKSLLSGLFGGDKEQKQVNQMRQQFVDAAGGLAALDAKAHAAGKTLTDMLNAKTVQDYQAAVNDLTGAFDLQGVAQSKLQAAQEKYGIGWSALDAQAGQLLQDQNLLIAAGYSQEEVANGMADAYSQYVQQVIAGGGTIPEAMRSTIELLGQQGKLVDENGQAYDDATLKGLNFTDKLTDQMSKLVDEIHRMVNALLGINDVQIDIPVRSHTVNTGDGEAPVRLEDHGHAGGTQGFQDFGGGTRTTLHGREMVARPNDLQAVARMMASVMGDDSSSSNTTVVNMHVGNRQFGRAVAVSGESGYNRSKQMQRGRQR